MIETGMDASGQAKGGGLSRRALLAGTAAAGAAVATWRTVNVTSGQGDAPFTIANESEPATLGPWPAGFGGWLVTRQIYETLAEVRMTRNEAGAVEIGFVPKLAERWERVDDLRWRFFLRPDVVFHNGEAWNADAAKVSFDALSDADALAEIGLPNLLALFTGCEVVDPMTVDFVTARPDNEALSIYLRIGFSGLPPEMLRSQGLAAFAEQAVGSGPYQLRTFERGQEIVLDKFADHWNPDGPQMTSVRYVPRPDASVRAQTIQAGEADFAFNIGGEQAGTLDRSVIGGGFQSNSLRLNNTLAPMDDVRVRQAVNYALDREGIAEAIFAGTAVPIGFFAFQPVTVEPFPYDPERSAALLEEAGATGTEVELVYGEGRVPEEDQLAEIFKASLDAVGLPTTLRKVEPLQYNDISAAPFADQPQMLMETTSSGNYGEIAGGLRDKYGCEGTGTFCDEGFDAEFDELATLDGEARVTALQSIAERLQFEETPRAWVAGVQQVHGLAEGVETDLPLNAYILLDDIRLV